MVRYLDNSATTRVDEDVMEAMLPYFQDYFGNPSSQYRLGKKSKEAIEFARTCVADSIKCSPSEVYFTSGGTEADNWALKGVLKPGDHLITDVAEHHAILNTCKYLESIGVEVTYLKVNKDGRVDTFDIYNAIKDNTKLISVMMLNNETGVVNHFGPLVRLTAQERGILLHTDAVQAYGKMPIDAKFYDMISVSGHKVGCPKGIGFLYIKEGTKIDPLIHGGGQERGMRAGTENVPYIVGMGVVAEKISNMDFGYSKEFLYFVNEYMEEKSKEYPWFKGKLRNGYVPILSFTFSGVNGEELIEMLDYRYGICVSSGSACSSNDGKLSHVLKAIGKSDVDVRGTIRISFQEDISVEDAKEVLDIIFKCANTLKKYSE